MKIEKLVKGDQGSPATLVLMAEKHARSVAGFTMIELMITIIIICILLGLAIPGFSRWLPNYRLRGAARDLYSNLQLAKSGAIKDRGEWAIRFTSATSYEVWSWRDSTNSTNATNSQWNSFSPTDDTLIKTVDLSAYGSGITLSGGTIQPPAQRPLFTTVDASNPIYFTSRGFMPTTTQLCAYMTNNRNTWYSVGALASGFVDLKRWNGAWQ